MLRDGVTVGAAGAPVKIVEFSDLECPFCRRFHEAVVGVREQSGGDVAHVFIHFPLSSHRFARPAARPAECAADQGRFASFVDLVFAKQDSLGLKPWSAFARDAAMPDTTRFAGCIADTTRVPRVEAGVALGEEMDIRGTPTVIVNGWRLPAAPDSAELARIVTELLAGREPF